jgi:hypothetical protein
MKRQAANRLAFGAAAVVVALLIADPVPAAGQPKVKFKETVWDFGKVKQGALLSHEFTLTNEGNATLIIQKVSTSCGCTAALVSADRIQPGKEGRIEVKFDTRGYGGQVRKLIYVDTNAPGESHRQLEVGADIEVPPSARIDLSPYNYDAGLVVEGEEIKAKLKVINKGELELRVEFNHRSATFRSGGKPIAAPLKIASGKEVTIEVGIPTQSRMGVVREYVLVKSNDPMRSTLSMYLSGYIISRVQLKELFDRYKDILR